MSAIHSYRNQSSMTDYDDNAAEDRIACICCGGELSELDPFCQECYAPMEVSRSVMAREVQPNLISVLGASNAGKTVYLGLLLDMLGRRSSPLRGAAQGTFSISLQEQVINALQKCRFPEKTPTESDLWKWLHCELSWAESKKITKQVDFIAPDFAGEAVASELDQAGMYPAIRHVVSRSCGILILCDSAEVRDSSPREDLFAMKLASYISDLHPHSAGAKAAELPAIAVVFTKSDTCPEAEADPELFAQNNMPRFIDFCDRRLPNYAFFSASVIGASCMVTDEELGPRNIPLHIQPRGVTEPLQWLVGQC